MDRFTLCMNLSIIHIGGGVDRGGSACAPLMGGPPLTARVKQLRMAVLGDVILWIYCRKLEQTKNKGAVYSKALEEIKVVLKNPPQPRLIHTRGRS